MASNLISSDRTIRAIKKEDNVKRLSDGDGLYLLPFYKDGDSHGWRFDYTFETKRKTISLGIFPETSLALARQKAREAREHLAAGTDPSLVRKEKKKQIAKAVKEKELEDAGIPLDDSFEGVARALWRLKWSPDDPDTRQWSPVYADRWIGRLELDVFPYFGKRKPDTIEPIEILERLQKVEERGAYDTAQKLCQSIGEVFRYGIVTRKCKSDPTRDLRGALKRHVVKHYAAVTNPEDVKKLLKDIISYRGRPVTRTALVLAALFFQRPGNIAMARWEDMDLDKGEWEIPAQDMKRRVEGKKNGATHIVPLPTQAVALLRDLKPLTGRSEWVFAGTGKSGHMSNNTLGKALHRMGYDGEVMTAHGFRAMARTVLIEQTEFRQFPNNIEVVEAQLAHSKKGSLGNAYDRTLYLEDRRKMMQIWADYLYGLAGKREA